MVSQTAEYALRAAVCLGSHPDTPLITQQIAEITRVPAGYLAKVMQSLVRAGLVNSQRGLHGGFMLARTLERISVLDVINAVDPLKRIEHCPLGLPAHGTRLCPLHKRIDEAMARVEKEFRECTLETLLTEPTESKPLCNALTMPVGPRS